MSAQNFFGSDANPHEQRKKFLETDLIIMRWDAMVWCPRDFSRPFFYLGRLTVQSVFTVFREYGGTIYN